MDKMETMIKKIKSKFTKTDNEKMEEMDFINLLLIVCTNKRNTVKYW